LNADESSNGATKNNLRYNLGFIFVSSLDFHPHIDFTTSKALRVLGFVRRHYTNFDNPKCISTLYNAIIIGKF